MDELGHFTELIGPTSIVRALRTILNAPGEPRLYSLASVPNSLRLVSGVEMAGNTGAMAETWGDSAISALGECVERYCCAVQPSDLRVASAAEIGAHALTIDDFELFAEAQSTHPEFPFSEHSADLKIPWVCMTQLSDDAVRYVPACLVYIPYSPQRPDEKDMLALSISSGQACHSDRDAAVLSGLCEVVERDAFMLTWVRRLTPERLDIASHLELAAWYDRYFANTNLKMDTFRLPSDIDVPTVLCVARGTTELGEFACVGASCRPKEADAVKKAMIEAAQGAVWARDLVRNRPDWEPDERFSNVRDFPDHVRLFANPDMMRHLDFLYGGPLVPVTLDDRADASVGSSISHCVASLQAAGMEPLVCDITTPDVAAAGLVVVRVMVPGSIQLYAVHGLPYFGHTRYDTVPEKLGFTNTIHREFNRIPHPFP